MAAGVAYCQAISLGILVLAVAFTVPVLASNPPFVPNSITTNVNDSVVLLGSLNQHGSTGGPGVWRAELTLVEDLNADMPSLGEGMFHDDGDTGTYNFTSESDAHFDAVATLLTNGQNETIQLGFLCGGGSYQEAGEGYWLGRNPDLFGYAVDLIRLVIQNLSITLQGDSTYCTLRATWEIWGHQPFVAFVPPTDPDGTYLIDRRDTAISVVLAASGIPTLEWDEVNETMNFLGGTWSRTKANLTDGSYSYRVWANDSTGALHATQERRITVGVKVWRAEVIAPGATPSVAIDSAGHPHVCYSDVAGLAYAVRNSSGWHLELVDAGGSDCSIALDKAGDPHISYDTRSGSLDYAFHSSTGWTLETVDSAGPTTYAFPSIAVDPSSNRPVIAYYDGASLKLASKGESSWTYAIVDQGGITGQNPSLAVDDRGHPRVSYLDYTNRFLKYAEWNGTSWRNEVLDSSDMNLDAHGISMALDRSGFPHVLYTNSNGLRYAAKTANSWQIETAYAGKVRSISLAMNASGVPEIAYGKRETCSDGRYGEVRFARKTVGWEYEAVAHQLCGGSVSLALNLTGGPSIVYADVLSGQVFFADRIAGDKVPPSTSIALFGSVGNPQWFVSPVTVSLAATDDMLVEHTAYRVDDGPWLAYPQPFILGEDGNHLVQFFSVDYAGNVEPTQSKTFGVDRHGPILSEFPSSGIRTSSQITISWTGSDAASGVAGYTIRVDGGPPENIGVNTSVTLVLQDGVHTIQLIAFDQAGNSVNQTTTLRVDTNIFSPSGPYFGAPTFAIVALATGGLFYFFWKRRRRGARPPKEP